MVKVAIMGHGTVGSGVYEVFEMNAEKIARTVGEPVEVKYVLDLRDFSSLPYGHKFVTDFSVIENDPEVTVVAEVMGGVGAAYQFTKRCLEAGRASAPPTRSSSRRRATSCSRSPRSMASTTCSRRPSAAASRSSARCSSASLPTSSTRSCGILNGTTNYILTQMIHNGVTFEDALRQAQVNGYAEKDPTADIEGHDACRKEHLHPVRSRLRRQVRPGYGFLRRHHQDHPRGRRKRRQARLRHQAARPLGALRGRHGLCLRRSSPHPQGEPARSRRGRIQRHHGRRQRDRRGHVLRQGRRQARDRFRRRLPTRSTPSSTGTAAAASCGAMARRGLLRPLDTLRSAWYVRFKGAREDIESILPVESLSEPVEGVFVVQTSKEHRLPRWMRQPKN